MRLAGTYYKHDLAPKTKSIHQRILKFQQRRDLLDPGVSPKTKSIHQRILKFDRPQVNRFTLSSPKTKSIHQRILKSRPLYGLTWVDKTPKNQVDPSADTEILLVVPNP